MKPISITIGRPVPPERLVARRVGKLMLAASVLLVIFQTLFPFDFASSPGSWTNQIARRFSMSVVTHEYDGDRVENILFFLPFGFSLAAVVWAKRRAWLWQLGGGLLTSAVMSLAVEMLQVFVPSRDPSFNDVLSNAIGGLFGAGIYAGVGEPALHALGRLLLRARSLLTPRSVAIVIGAYAAAMIALPLLVHDPGDLHGWDLSLPLAVGNEGAGGRPWKGAVYELHLATRAIDADEALLLAAGQLDVAQAAGDAVRMSYRTRGPGPYPDATGTSPPLEWVNQPLPPPAGAPALFGDGAFLRTRQSVAGASHAVASAGQFTAIVQAAATETFQHGPARIVAIDYAERGTNLVLAQERSDLVLRVRNALFGYWGGQPQLIVRDVFATTGLRHIVFSYSGVHLFVYIDGIERGRLRLTPETAAIWKLYPRDYWRLNLDAAVLDLYAALYRLLVFAPLGALLAAWFTLRRWPLRKRWTWSGGVMVLLVLAFEGVMTWLDPAGLRLHEPVLSLLIAAGTMLLLLFRHGRPVLR